MIELYAVALAACGVAMVTDLIERRILNVLTVPLMVVGIVIHAVWDPVGLGRFSGVLGLFALGVPFFVMYLFNIVGPGDVKLLMGVGAVLGLPSTPYVGFFVVVMGGIVSLVSMLATSRLGQLGKIFRYGWYRFTGRGDLLESPEPYKIPMGLAILVGVFGYIALRSLATPT